MSLELVTELIDSIIGPQSEAARAREERAALTTLGYAPWQGEGIATKGCPRCKGTMYRVKDKNERVWICRACAYVE